MFEAMACGHSANATRDGKPACCICSCYEVVSVKPSLEGRKAHCRYNHASSVTDSRWDLAFFEHMPNGEYDYYYCGCYGWD